MPGRRRRSKRLGKQESAKRKRETEGEHKVDEERSASRKRKIDETKSKEPRLADLWDALSKPPSPKFDSLLRAMAAFEQKSQLDKIPKTDILRKGWERLHRARLSTLEKRVGDDLLKIADEMRQVHVANRVPWDSVGVADAKLLFDMEIVYGMCEKRLEVCENEAVRTTCALLRSVLALYLPFAPFETPEASLAHRNLLSEIVDVLKVSSPSGCLPRKRRGRPSKASKRGEKSLTVSVRGRGGEEKNIDRACAVVRLIDADAFVLKGLDGDVEDLPLDLSAWNWVRRTGACATVAGGDDDEDDLVFQSVQAQARKMDSDAMDRTLNAFSKNRLRLDISFDASRTEKSYKTKKVKTDRMAHKMPLIRIKASLVRSTVLDADDDGRSDEASSRPFPGGLSLRRLVANELTSAVLKSMRISEDELFKRFSIFGTDLLREALETRASEVSRSVVDGVPVWGPATVVRNARSDEEKTQL
eukprot:g2966.t1